MKLQHIDAIHLQLFPDQVGILEYVLGREDVAVLVLRQRRPAIVCRRNLRRRIQALAFVALHGLAQESIALSFAIRPRRIKKIAAQINRQLQRS